MTQRMVENTLHTLAHFCLYRFTSTKFLSNKEYVWKLNLSLENFRLLDGGIHVYASSTNDVKVIKLPESYIRVIPKVKLLNIAFKHSEFLSKSVASKNNDSVSSDLTRECVSLQSASTFEFTIDVKFSDRLAALAGINGPSNFVPSAVREINARPDGKVGTASCLFIVFIILEYVVNRLNV